MGTGAKAASSLAWALAPAAAALLLAPAAAPGPEGLFQSGLGGLVVAAVLGGLGTPTRAAALVRLPAAAVLLAAAHVLLGGRAAQAPAVAFLALGVGVAASGLAALGRRVGAPAFPAGAVACLVLWTALTGLHWADAVAGRLPERRRRAFRQAVLHVDPALALAYDGAGFDRLRHPPVYRDLEVASSLVERPRAASTGSVWLAVGLASAGAAWLLGRGARARGAGDDGPAAGARP